MLRLCFYHPRVTSMKWKNLDVTRVTSGRSWPLATSARRQSRCLLYPRKRTFATREALWVFSVGSFHEPIAWLQG